MKKKEIISTAGAPEAIGPYSQAIRFDGLLYCSGQIALDPETMQLSGSDVETQTRQVMENLGEVLRAGGSDYSGVIRCSIFLTDMDDFGTVNSVYAGYFPEEPPARETVAVRTLPKQARIEISCIAHLTGSVS